MAKVDQWKTWRALLARQEVVINEDDPAPGYYRVRNTKKGPWLPVVFWYDVAGVLRCLHGLVEVDDLQQMRRLWLWAAKNAIPTATYKVWAATGTWVDVDDAVATQVAEEGSNVADIPAEELLADQIESALASLNKYAKIDSDETAAAAQSLRARLLELKGEADKTRVKEKAPHLEAGRQVDIRWMPLVNDAEAGAVTLRKALNAWETEKLAQLRAAEAAERDRLQAEHQAEVEAAQEHALPEPEAPVEPDPVKVETQVKGGYGKAASVRTKWIVAEITDLAALFAFYKHRPEVHAVLLKLANDDVKRSRDIPGIKPQEVADVR